MEQEVFIVKCYDKRELAQLYFPHAKGRVAVNRLRRWMHRCEPLMAEIQATDFHPR